MKRSQTLLAGLLLATLSMSNAMAQRTSILLNTTQGRIKSWTTYEISKGKVQAGAARYYGLSWGKLPSITIPFTNCDGYWYAKTKFHIPVGATNMVLKITGLGVDDRAVLFLNNARIASVGTKARGAGQMQFHDPGENVPYTFDFIAGKVLVTDTTHLKPGRNVLKVKVNNTGNGIYGSIRPVSNNSPSAFGITAKVTFDR